MDKISCMRCYCAVVKEGGFSAAARKMGISKVLISRNLAALEDDLGLRLLQRTTRKMSPTDDGLAYYERCLAILEDLDELEGAIKDRGHQVAGKLRLSIPSESFSVGNLVPFFTDFVRRYPALELDLTLSDRFVDIVDEGFDAALRIGSLEDSSLIARKLADMKILLCASPNYLERRPKMLHPSDIQGHEMVIDTNYRAGLNCLFTQGDERISIKTEARVRVNSSMAVMEFLKSDLGIGICPNFMVKKELATGQLVRLFEDWELGSGGIYLVYSHRKHLSAKVNLLAEELSRYFQTLDF